MTVVHVNRKILLCTALLLFAIFNVTQAQSIHDIEKDLVELYKRLENCQLDTSEERFYKLEQLNEEFTNKIISHLSEHPNSLQYKFDSLKALNIHIADSEDKKLRIYSWDTWQGGTMRDFRNIFQYKVGDSIFSKLVYDSRGEDYIPFYSQIFSINIKEQTYYLAVGNGIHSTRDAGESITAFTIKEGVVHESRLFKEGDTLTSDINLFFDFFSVVDRPERPLQLIKYNQKKRIIYLPIVADDGKVTKKYIRYKFNGKYFAPYSKGLLIF